jgi:hypothetical protein
MKKNIIKKLVLLSMIVGVLFTACEDDFTEKDALDAQQTIDVSVYVYDVVSDLGLANAEVKMIMAGTEETITTNDLGIAYFTKVKIASNVLISVEKADYAKIYTSINISTDNYRQSQYTANVALYSLTENTATIKGKLEIETDLTNDETEFATEGANVYAYLSNIDGSSVEFVATVDANGNYEFIVPADNYGASYELKYPTFELDQTIAINGNEGDSDFPETFPTIETINTLFNPIGSALSVPWVPSVYAYISNSEVYDETAIINNVDINSDGEVSDIDFSDYGSGYTADSVDVTVVSLFEGSGAVIRIGVQGGSVYDWNAVYHNQGSGYPVFDNANQTSSNSPSFATYVSDLKPGEIRIIDGDYGTGILRDREIQ